MWVVVVHPEVDSASEASSVTEARRGRGDTQSSSVFEVIETEVDVSIVKCNIGTSLNIRGAAAGIVNRFTIYRDSHKIEGEWILGRQLAGDWRDIDTFKVVHHRKLVVDDLHEDVRSFAVNKSAVYYVFGVHEAASFVLDLRVLES